MRSASIGGNDDAFIAGYIPNEIPITTENDTEISIHSKEMTAGHAGIILTARMPNPIPIAPPTLSIK